MSKKLSEEAPQAPRPLGAVDKIRKQARQLAYDVRYKVKGKFKEGQKTSPAALKQAYLQQLGASSAPGPVKSLAKKMLIGEEYDMYDISETLEHSNKRVISNVFSEGNSFILRVKDERAGSQYTRSYRTYEAAQSKKSDLEKKGLKVEIVSSTQSGQGNTYDRKDGKPNDGNLANNRKPYDKVTRGDVIAGAQGKDEMGGRRRFKEGYGVSPNYDATMEEVIYEKEENGEKKLDVMKGKNKVNVTPTIGEQKDRQCKVCGKTSCGCKTKEGEEDPRENWAKSRMFVNKLRAMGLKMSYDMEGEQIDEATPLFYKLQKAGKKGCPTARAQLKTDASLESQKSKKMRQQQSKQRQQRNSEDKYGDPSLSASERNPGMK